jgi:hypothetical protein
MPLFIEMPVSCQESEGHILCVRRIAILPLSMIVLLNFGNNPSVVFFILFINHSFLALLLRFIDCISELFYGVVFIVFRNCSTVWYLLFFILLSIYLLFKVCLCLKARQL